MIMHERAVRVRMVMRMIVFMIVIVVMGMIMGVIVMVMMRIGLPPSQTAHMPAQQHDANAHH